MASDKLTNGQIKLNNTLFTLKTSIDDVICNSDFQFYGNENSNIRSFKLSQLVMIDGYEFCCRGVFACGQINPGYI